MRHAMHLLCRLILIGIMPAYVLADPARPGGDTTQDRPVNSNSFSHPAANLSHGEEMTFKLGNALFKKLWVSSPASTQSSDGVGPLHNARSCQRCHIKDGRGKPLREGDSMGVSGSVLRLLHPDGEGDPVYGVQIQDFAVPGLAGEAQIHTRYTEVERFGLSLRRPDVSLKSLSHGPLDEATGISVRTAQPMIGLGLLEAIPEADILAGADPDDADGDGISGRAHRLADGSLGRFNWKASSASIIEQSRKALKNDMGLSSGDFHHYGDCSETQTDCFAMAHGGSDNEAEVTDKMLDWIVFYAAHLAVPARSDLDNEVVIRGEALFDSLACIECHRPSWTTGDSPFPALGQQTIYPYTDMLLHDMGEGLADPLAEGDASGREWRTAPLWGLGKTQAVSGHMQLLHDGRAASIEEAIAWHGGEAQHSAERFFALPDKDKAALLAFLESL